MTLLSLFALLPQCLSTFHVRSKLQVSKEHWSEGGRQDGHPIGLGIVSLRWYFGTFVPRVLFVSVTFPGVSMFP